MEKRYTVKANGVNEETGKKTWGLFDKMAEQFLPQYEGGRFLLQGIAQELNEGNMTVAPEVTEIEAEGTKAEDTVEVTADSTGRVVGYMRISTTKEEQKFDRQEAQLSALGAEVIYQDRMSGAKRERPELNKMLEELQEGDTVLIVAIDRLSRSTKDLLEIVELIKTKGAFLKSINDSWLDTTSANPMNDFLLTVMGALGQMERAMITQRVQEGVNVAKAKGVRLGRPKANSNKVAHALELYDAGQHTVKQIVDITGVSKATIFRKIKEREAGQL